MSEKYIAGFIDADGHISIRCRVNSKPDLEVSMSQRADFLDPLYEAQEMFGGAIRNKFEGQHCELQIRSGPARKCVERLKKYLVVKRYQAEQYLGMVDAAPILRSKEEVVSFRKDVKSVRRVESLPVQNYPTRKWMAGYIDGDGSFGVKVCKKTGYAYPTLSILSADNYTAGILLLKKAFGGRICRTGTSYLWQLQLSQPSKSKQVLGYFTKYLEKKQDVARFLYECAKNGNFRDGEAIRNIVKTLNSQQHRLSDSTATVKESISTINFGIVKKKVGRPVGVIETRPRRKRQSKLQEYVVCRKTD